MKAQTTTKRTGRLSKMADFFIGVPLVILLGGLRTLLQGRRRPPTEIRTIAILQTAAIGDTLLMSSIWQDLRARFPAAQATVYVGESNLEIARLLFGANNVCLLPVKKPLQSLRRCRRESADVVLDYGPWPRWNALLALAFQARWRAGFRTPGQYRHYAYDAAVLHSGTAHELANHRALVASLGVPTIHPPAIPLDAVSAVPDTSAASRRVILHPWAGGFRAYDRQWPADRWIELARRLVADGWDVELSGGPSDRSESAALAVAMRDAGLAVTDRAGAFDFAGLARHLRSTHAVISVNTGMMHFAAVAGVLTLGLHGPTQARRWGPVGPKAVAIESPCPGCGFLDLGFEYPKIVPPCMDAITVDQVWDAFLAAAGRSS